MAPNEHECLKEDTFIEINRRQDRLESDLEKEAQKTQTIKEDHEDLKKAINGKLNKIWDKMQEGDDKNTKYIFLTNTSILQVIYMGLDKTDWLRIDDLIDVYNKIRLYFDYPDEILIEVDCDDHTVWLKPKLDMGVKEAMKRLKDFDKYYLIPKGPNLNCRISVDIGWK